MMTHFYLVRHAEPDWAFVKAKGLTGRHMDFCPLTEIGIKQAAAIAKKEVLANAQIVLSSPYTRALQTAAIMSQEMRLPLVVEYDLHEWIPNFDQRYTWSELVNVIMVEFKRSLGAPSAQIPPYIWESPDAVRQRVQGVLERYISFSQVIVVTHGVLIGCLLPDATLAYGEVADLTFGSHAKP